MTLCNQRWYLVYSYAFSDEEVWPVPGYVFRSSKKAEAEAKRQQQLADNSDLGIRVYHIGHKPEGK